MQHHELVEHHEKPYLLRFATFDFMLNCNQRHHHHWINQLEHAAFLVSASLLSCLCFTILNYFNSSSINKRFDLESRPVEFNQIQTGFEDSSMMTDQTLSPGLFEPAVYMINGLQPASWSKFSGSATHNQLSRVSSPSKQQMSFCNNTPFWNPSTANSAPVKIPEPRFEDESTVSNLIPMKVAHP